MRWDAPRIHAQFVQVSDERRFKGELLDGHVRTLVRVRALRRPGSPSVPGRFSVMDSLGTS